MPQYVASGQSASWRHSRGRHPQLPAETQSQYSAALQSASVVQMGSPQALLGGGKQFRDGQSAALVQGMDTQR
jgi:hypothetical protein